MAKKMKESGIEWVGVVPEDWNVFPGRKCAAEVKQKNKDLSEKTALRFSYGTIIPKSNFDPESEKYVEDTISNYTVVKPGDLVLNGLNLNFDFITKRVGLVKQPGAMTSAYLTIRPFNFFNSSYLCYLLKSYDEITVFHNMGTGVRKTLKYSDFKYLPILYPELDTQEKIVSYLDSKCSQIDHQIDQQEALIVELEDYKKSLITESVTKGFDPNVEMKDSGIEWIGRIPDAWNQTRLKYCFENVSSGSWGKDHGEDEEDLICLRVADFDFPSGSFKNKDIEDYTVRSYPQKKISDLYLKKGDIILEKSGGGEKTPVGRAVLFNMDISATCSNFCAQLHPCSRFINSVYLEYWFRAWYSQGCSRFYINQTTGIQNLNLKSVFSSEIVPVPELEEQSAIVSYLDTKCAQIDHQIEKRKELIEKLKEYKSSLIYETVTGKREVPIDES